jgi:hypothetical protein
VYRLPALEAPAPSPALTAAQALTFPAVRVFVDRAAAGIAASNSAMQTHQSSLRYATTLTGCPWRSSWRAAALTHSAHEVSRRCWMIGSTY